MPTDYPPIRPSLLLDFANTKTLDPRITYTRASAGTYYDGKTVAKAEENLLVRSQEFENSSWTKSNLTITANSETAPDGTTTAETYTATANNSELYQGYTAVAQTYTFSVFLKRKTGTGTVSILGDGGTYVAQTITSSWARYSVTQTPTAGAKVVSIRLGTSGDEVYVWGAQLEQRSTVTAYTATTTAPITNYVPVLLSAPANVARFEHNPVTGESLGLEIEEQRTNLMLYSSQYDDANWLKRSTTITTNTTVAPDGTLTGDAIVGDGTSNVHGISQEATASGSTIHTGSVYLKQGTERYAYVYVLGRSVTDDNADRFWVDLQTGTIVGTEGSGASATITPVGNGWYRASMPTSAYPSSTRIELRVGIATGAFNQLNTLTGYIFVWGAQLEAGRMATSYIPTVASQVTRSADLAIMTGTNFSSWYRVDEGSFYYEIVKPIDTFYNAAFYAGKSTDQNYIGVDGTNTATPRLVVVYAGVVQTTLAIGPAWSSGSNKGAVVYKVNDFAGSSNGGTVTTDTLGNLPLGIVELNIGTNGIQRLNSTIKKLAYYPARLTNAEIQSLTVI